MWQSQSPAIGGRDAPTNWDPRWYVGESIKMSAKKTGNPENTGSSQSEHPIQAVSAASNSARMRERGTSSRQSATQLSNDDPAMYLNRELSWISFNQRVLNEAKRPRTPLLERVKFLAIVSANIDEFYMKRLGGLKQQIGAGVTRLTVDGRTPEEQLNLCRHKLFSMQKEKETVCREVLEALTRHGIELCSYASLEATEQGALLNHYVKHILPLVTPLVVDRSHPFPFISNLSLNLLVTMLRPDVSQELQARVKIPVGTGVSRFMRVGNGHRFVQIEDVMMNNLDLLFPQSRILSCDVFRITRSAITDNDRADVEDMLELIENELHDRKFAPVVRLQISADMYPARRRTLVTQLRLNEDKDVFESGVLVRMSDLMELASLDCSSMRKSLRTKLTDKPHHPHDNYKLVSDRSVFDIVRENGSVLLQHPYESFTASVGRFVREASLDPRVAAIKMTLYRTSEDTRILQNLIDAAHRGKQVAVVVELKARFDEAANIQWAARLEQAGIHVNFGIAGLKTHCKTILVLRRDDDGLRHYAHIGTGNYHAGTARHYSDLGLLTCDPLVTNDLSQLFNYLTTGCHPQRQYQRILVAPRMIKSALLNKIDREIDQHSDQLPGLIRLKTNALEDPDITHALYCASQAGVTVELIVRDICRLRPQLPEASENIGVISIIGRFLEHSRVYYFRNGGDEEYFIGSADLMTRNLERRVELLVPVEDAEAQEMLASLLSTQLSDNYGAWEMQSDGTYVQCAVRKNQLVVDSQTAINVPQNQQSGSDTSADLVSALTPTCGNTRPV